MQRLKGQLVFSPHDLMAFQLDPLVAWFDRLHFELNHEPSCPFVLDLPREQFKPDEPDDEQVLIARVGLEHEADHAKWLAGQHGLRVIEDRDLRWKQTLDAMAAGADAIAGGELRRGRLTGKPDFLLRSKTASRFGGWSYVPRDAKLAREPRPQHVIQLCAYAWMLEDLQGVRPATIEFALGTKQVMALPTDRYFYLFLRLFDDTLRFHDEFDPRRPPDVGLARDFGHWSTVAGILLQRADHVRQVAGITLLQARRLVAAGIATMPALATRKTSVPRMEPATLQKLRQQASLQLRSRGQDKPVFELVPPDPENPRRGLALLPEPDEADLFFDMEGFPLEQDGLEYLFGVVCRDRGKTVFHDWWAHDEEAERVAFEQFIDFAHARWRKHPRLHIYHYAAYEKTALRRLMGKYGTREDKVDDLLRNEVFVDLYTVVRQGVRIGTPGYSLKDIEPLFAPPRVGEVKTAKGSVVAYQAWRDSGQPGDWRQSDLLKEIRDYNEIDCRSLVSLRDWLIGLRGKPGKPRPNAARSRNPTSPGSGPSEQKEKRPSPNAMLAEALLEQLDRGAVGNARRAERQRLLAHLLGFHWREQKPGFWRMFDRAEATEDELFDDIDCLAGLTLVSRDKEPGGAWYRFSPEQETKLEPGDRCLFAHDINSGCTLEQIDFDHGVCLLHLGPDNHPPKRVNLIPDENVPPRPRPHAVFRYVESWVKGRSISRAVDDLLDRRHPRIKGHDAGPLVKPAKPLLPQLVKLVGAMDRTTLCVQGPPGTGKTYSTGHVVAELLRAGKKVGITALSHKAILKTLEAVVDAARGKEIDAAIFKVTGSSDADADHPYVKRGFIEPLSALRGEAVCDSGAGPFAVGGTSFFFSRKPLAGTLDYLFIDEAGQFSLADCVAVGLSAKNLVLVGDPQQLAQPIQGSHPGESGRSGLDYLLNGQATVPPEMGVLLDRTYRLHPRLCDLVSRMTYDGRLKVDDSTRRREIKPPRKAGLLDREVGVLFIPVEHVGNSQCSDEEVEVIEGLVAELLRGHFVQDGQARRLTLADILFVAPFNMQVARLRRALGRDARVGSVDKFQGQEAPVVIVSMCSSTLEDSPRGPDFLLSPNRLNVAVSRAKCLAAVVSSPRLLSARCTTLKQMEHVNRLCWIEHHARTSR